MPRARVGASVMEKVKVQDNRYSRFGLERVNDCLQRLYSELGPPEGGES
jgi:hypothetical protein